MTIPEKDSSRIHIGIIGAGRQADYVHIPCLEQFQDVCVTALCDINAQRLQATGSRHDIQDLYTDYEEMLRQASLDAVYVVTTPHVAFEISHACLKRGLDVFIEKPPAMNSDETAELLDIAESKGCKTMVGFNRRFSPLLAEAKRLVESSGPIATVVSEFHTFNEDHYRAFNIPEQVLEHFIVAQTIHHIDLVRFLCGDMKEVYSVVDRVFGRYDDNIAALMKSERDVVVELSSNFTTATRLERIAMYGKRICAWLEGPETRRPRLAYGFEWAKVVKEGITYRLTNSTDDDLRNAGFWHENQFFVECLRTGRKPAFPAADLSDALKTMLLVEKINRGRKAHLR